MLALIVALPSFGLAAAEKTIVMGAQQEPDSINPYLCDMLAAADCSSIVYSGLLAIDQNWELKPEIATEVPSLQNGGISADGLTYTFHLRKDVKFSDGQPLTSADVKFTQDYIMNPKTNAITTQGWDKVKETLTPDPYTVIFKLKEKFAPFLVTWAGGNGGILPKHALENSEDVNKDPFNRAPIGTGPFKFEKWQTGEYLSFVKNPYYYRPGYPKVNRIVYKIIPDENTMLTQFTTHEIDIYQAYNNLQHATISALKGVKTYQTQTTTYEHIGLNLKRPILSDVRVRQALAYALDLNAISKTIYLGLWKLASSEQASPFWHNAKVKNYPYSPAKAKALLDQAGWVDTDKDGIREKDGQKLQLSISTTAGRKPREQFEQMTQQLYKDIGVDLVIQNYPASKFFAPFEEGGIIYTGQYDLAVFAWVASPDPDVYSTLSSNQWPPDGQNGMFYKNARVDELAEAGTTELDVKKRKAIYDEVQAITIKELPYICTFYWTNLDATWGNIGGFKPNGCNVGNFWNCYEWTKK